METEKGTDPNHRIYTVEEIEANSYQQARRDTFVLVVVILSFFSGLCMIPFIHSLFWQDTAAAMLTVVLLASMLILTICSPSPEGYTFVGMSEMLSICKMVEAYPELREAICRILAIRPVLTQAEYRRFKEAIDRIATKAADIAAADAWAAALEHLQCGDSAVLER